MIFSVTTLGSTRLHVFMNSLPQLNFQIKENAVLKKLPKPNLV